VEDVLRFEQEFLDFLGRSHEGILAGIRESKAFDEGTSSALEKGYDAFLDQFETSEGKSVKPGTDPEVDAVTDEELEQETIVKQKRG
jgi:F-type H+-transporting ATPase subunit alpha